MSDETRSAKMRYPNTIIPVFQQCSEIEKDSFWKDFFHNRSIGMQFDEKVLTTFILSKIDYRPQDNNERSEIIMSLLYLDLVY